MVLESATIGVIGAGTMGAGIAETAALNRHRVLVADSDPARPAAAIAAIAARQRSRVERGKIGSDTAEAAIARLSPVETVQMTGCELIIEAVAEDMDAKAELFTLLERHVDERAILASNTSSLSITELGSRLLHPGRMAGLHFFNPVPAIKLVEVVRGAATDTEVTDRLADLMTQWRKVPVQCTSTPGFIVNRVARPFYGEAFRALAEGLAPPEIIDQLDTEGGGFAMGPLRLADLVGQDVNRAVNRSVWSQFDRDPWFRPARLQDQLVAAGWLGRKTGRGVYRYDTDPDDPQTSGPSTGSGREETGSGSFDRLRMRGESSGSFDRLRMRGDKVTTPQRPSTGSGCGATRSRHRSALRQAQGARRQAQGAGRQAQGARRPVRGPGLHPRTRRRRGCMPRLCAPTRHWSSWSIS